MLQLAVVLISTESLTALAEQVPTIAQTALGADVVLFAVRDVG
jgi:hypothetical protein